MNGSDKQRNLKVEELEHRVAPMGLVYTNPEPEPDPSTGGSDPTVAPEPPQPPGNSGGHRQDGKYNT